MAFIMALSDILSILLFIPCSSICRGIRYLITILSFSRVWLYFEKILFAPKETNSEPIPNTQEEDNFNENTPVSYKESIIEDELASPNNNNNEKVENQDSTKEITSETINKTPSEIKVVKSTDSAGPASSIPKINLFEVGLSKN